MLPHSRSGPLQAAQAGLDVPNVAAWIVAGTILMSVGRAHGIATILVAFRAPMILSALALVILLTSLERWKPSDLFKHWIPKTIGLIAIIAVAGFPFGIYPGQSLAFLNESFLRTLLVAVMAWAVARTPQGTRFIGQTIVLAAGTAATLALIAGRSDGDGRLAGANTYDANDLALVLVTSLPLCVWWALDKGTRFRWIPIVAIPLLVFAIIKTGSRGGFLALAAVIVGFLVVSRGSGKSKALKRASISVVVLALLTFPFLPAEYRERIQSITSNEDYNRDSESGRIQVWKRGLGYAVQYPVTGVGIGNFMTAEGRLSALARERQPGRGLKWSAAHNSFVQITAELGLIAGLAFLYLFARSIILLFRYGRSIRGELIGPVLAISLLAFAVGGFFLSFAYADLLYLLFALATAVLQRAQGSLGLTKASHARATDR
jgi:O-antigen ligase